MTNKTSRKDQILQVLAQMLENNAHSRVTTAALAKEVGVSEAALYRHFPSKARMYEGLIEFIEQTLFGMGKQLLNEELTTLERVQKYSQLILTFAERNPGLCRILVGDALIGEVPRLRERIQQLMDKLLLQYKQLLRESAIREDLDLQASAEHVAELLMAYVEGRIMSYARSDFTRKPTEQFDSHWQMLASSIA